ncbi:sensor histidine kinase [Actinoplanes regularis]|uniref:sensor histidine kinase n=1 Tax=Actinoplanes regularis TaxID=52697 RepID=UPI0024A30635|nr:ATP-binding protein [Actinoplanes regularis]GLW35155.1 histidine kinase [Actinoplanes regularis]
MPGAGRWLSWSRRRRPDQGELPAVPEQALAPPEPQPEPAQLPQPVQKPDPWRPIAGEFALRLLTLTWEAVHHIGEAEFREQDPERRKVLFRIDHSVTRVRRLAENLRVLTGEPFDDPDRQITSLHDVTHAAGSAVEHYERLHFGPIADLAVAAVAADDVIRILTELIDNADRYSPPTEPVTISAHLTGDGDVVIRVEDVGIGLNPAHLPWIERLLSDPAGPDAGDLHPGHLGLTVAAVLTHRHSSLRVRLVPRQARGTTAMLLIGAELLCEAPRSEPMAAPVPAAAPPLTGNHQNDVTMVLPVLQKPMPRRVPGSVRGAGLPPAAPVPAPAHQTAWHDDAADFNAGVDAARANASQQSATPQPNIASQRSATPQESTASQQSALQQSTALRQSAAQQSIAPQEEPKDRND